MWHSKHVYTFWNNTVLTNKRMEMQHGSVHVLEHKLSALAAPIN